jgi:hypothetical protein
MPSHPFISATTLLLSLCLTLTLTAQGTLAPAGEKTRPPATHRTAAISLKGGKKNTLIALMKSGALYRLAPAGTAQAETGPVGGKLRPERLLKVPKFFEKFTPIDFLEGEPSPAWPRGLTHRHRSHQGSGLTACYRAGSYLRSQGRWRSMKTPLLPPEGRVR